ncbi:MAG: hypothetical protein H0A76_05710 [Candidatus Thiodubiliella endoseptemdiera]|uniref:Uncharacterized protein n=1 Tax=Candidatus Thiodubiliella endoseptemdiera TaxID=2738886 RepID=A0A853F0P8_9GAMM|nr:hypothetical protein [Candidatus Thiodubiliella endoseptemdiera]
MKTFLKSMEKLPHQPWLILSDGDLEVVGKYDGPLLKTTTIKTRRWTSSTTFV